MNESRRPKLSAIWSHYQHLFVLLALFSITIWMRIGAFQEPIKGTHVWLTAHTAMTMQIWDKGGIASYHFNPVYTFDTPSDKHVRSLASGLSDQAGNFYYVSYPPFSFLLAYAFIQLFRLEPGIGALQVLNVLIQFATSWLLYVLVCRLFQRPIRNQIYSPALVASVIYLFSAQALWCHGYMYFADTVIQVFWVTGILLAFEHFFREKSNSWQHLAGIGLVVFLAAYTEWLGFFFAATLFAIALYYCKSDRKHFRLALVIVFSAAAALLVTLWQYSQINGLSALIETSTEKYMDRSGYMVDDVYFVRLQIMFILRHYWRFYFPILGIIVFLSIALFTHSSRPKRKPSPELAVLFSMVAVPILIHHAVFLEFSTAHDFSLLKSLILFSLAIAVLLQRNLDNAQPSQKRLYALLAGAFIAILLSLNVMTYYRYDADVSFDRYRITGQFINEHANDGEVIYVVSKNDRENGVMIYMGSERSLSPQVQLIARRNVLAVRDREAALRHMQEQQFHAGIIFSLDDKGYVVDTERIQLP